MTITMLSCRTMRFIQKRSQLIKRSTWRYSSSDAFRENYVTAKSACLTRLLADAAPVEFPFQSAVRSFAVRERGELGSARMTLWHRQDLSLHFAGWAPHNGPSVIHDVTIVQWIYEHHQTVHVNVPSAGLPIGILPRQLCERDSGEVR